MEAIAPYMTAKEFYISANEPYIPEKEKNDTTCSCPGDQIEAIAPYISAKEPYKFTK